MKEDNEGHAEAGIRTVYSLHRLCFNVLRMCFISRFELLYVAL